MGCHARDESAVVVGVRRADGIRLAALLEPAERVLAHDREQREHHAAVDLALLHEGCIDERREAVERHPVPRAPRAERLDRVEGEPRREHAEVLEQIPMGLGKEAHAPVDRRPHRAVPFGQVPDGGRQQRQALLEALARCRAG